MGVLQLSKVSPTYQDTFPIKKLVFTLLAFAGGFIFIFPLLWMVSASFKHETTVFQNIFMFYEPKNFILDNYNTVFSQPFVKWYTNSTIVAVGGIALKLCFNSLAAYAFAKLEFRGKNKIFLICLATMMIPMEAVIVPQYMLYRSLHLINKLIVLIIPNGFDAFTIFFLRQAFLSIPKELSESARIDGCGNFKILFRIIIPLAKTSMLAMGIIAFFVIWNQMFLEPLMFINSINKLPITVGIAFMARDHSSAVAAQMGAATLAIIPSLVIFLIFQKHFVQSIASSGIKG